VNGPPKQNKGRKDQTNECNKVSEEMNEQGMELEMEWNENENEGRNGAMR